MFRSAIGTSQPLAFKRLINARSRLESTGNPLIAASSSALTTVAPRASSSSMSGAADRPKVLRNCDNVWAGIA